MFSAASFSFSNRSLEVQAHDLELFHCARTGIRAAVGQGTSTVTGKDAAKAAEEFGRQCYMALHQERGSS